ncbi:hypothetical protein N7481_012900 [Penicillium waksmanii]|uniref:uncharacterized protein n=1 Tax=Penicillium waksmanii TaxID=69791 RepID=UPI002547300C|nr:uncharacterized protein N7481_012900 [Penicillium waksmanii]KAJ5966186.1 hypothetical protein N7481_012900 [Penicillium waksmanii]
MASTNSATKPIKKILDATKISSLTSKLVRRPLDPKARVPIQGRPREGNSNAFKEASTRESVRLQKALNAVAHGKHIFVYHNVRTKQVVYSLTRYLEKTNLLRQMVYHGKKTVPAELRRDMWVPYYSVHFGDARLGLRAYQLLREFSLQRQLAPPAEMITEFDKINLKRIGQTMEKRERARVLMNQKATSVADIAAALNIQDKAIANGLLDEASKRGYLTRKARQRRRAALERMAKHQEWNQEHIAALEQRFADLSGEEVEIGEADGEYPENAKDVKILWRDVHDAYFAESWPADVQHGELELKRTHIIGAELRPEGSDEVVTEHQFNERKEDQ